MTTRAAIKPQPLTRREVVAAIASVTNAARTSPGIGPCGHSSHDPGAFANARAAHATGRAASPANPREERAGR